jgi:hypothetical protein
MFSAPTFATTTETMNSEHGTMNRERGTDEQEP